MLKSAFILEVLAGKPLLIVEYRSFKPDTISYRDKKSGAQVSRVIAKHSVEMGESQVMVTEWMPDGTKIADMRAPFGKGSKVVLELQGMEPQQGFYKASGNLYPFEEDGKKL